MPAIQQLALPGGELDGRFWVDSETPALRRGASYLASFRSIADRVVVVRAAQLDDAGRFALATGDTLDLAGLRAALAPEAVR